MSEHGTKLVTTEDGVVAQAVKLGRDAKVRPFRRELLRPWRKHYQCKCCGAYSLDEVDRCDGCLLCGWEDWYECHDSPDEEIRPNYMSLNAARRVVTKYGAAACTHVNRARGIGIADLENMTPAEIAGLKSIHT